MKQNNQDIRKSIKDAGLNMYHVAHTYGLSDSNFSRLLRFELSLDEKKEILVAIEQAKEKFKGE